MVEPQLPTAGGPPSTVPRIKESIAESTRYSESAFESGTLETALIFRSPLFKPYLSDKGFRTFRNSQTRTAHDTGSWIMDNGFRTSRNSQTRHMASDVTSVSPKVYSNILWDFLWDGERVLRTQDPQ